jgi:hypothetical protein
VAKKYLPILYLACLLSPVAFLFGYIAGAPRHVVAPQLDFGGVDTRGLQIDSRAVENGGSILMDERLQLRPNENFQAR